MLPVNCGSHADYQHFVVTNFRKYYPDSDALAPLYLGYCRTFLESRFIFHRYFYG